MLPYTDNQGPWNSNVGPLPPKIPDEQEQEQEQEQPLGRMKQIRKTLKDAMDTKVTTKEGLDVTFGRMQMKQSEFETSEYCRMSLKHETGPETQLRGDMMCFIAERVWGLERPDLLVTVTGGAADFSLTTENEHELLTGVIAASQEMKV
eukprot:808749-Rhodomonas_salina.1